MAHSAGPCPDGGCGFCLGCGGQVEFADVIILNKLDVLGPERMAPLQALISRLNPEARVLPATHAVVDVSEVVGTGRFSLDRARQAPGWLKELRGEHVPETLEYGVSSFLYRQQRSDERPAVLANMIDFMLILVLVLALALSLSRWPACLPACLRALPGLKLRRRCWVAVAAVVRPFHPERLHALVYGPGSALASVVRIKGYVWLATRMRPIIFWSLAGSAHSFDCQGDRWLAATDPAQWPHVDMQELMKRWQPLWGDRRQEVRSA
jgi:G3E family GTPase